MSENNTISPKELKIILLFIISLVLIVVISYIDFFSFSNQVANEMISNSIPRLMGGIVFVVLFSIIFVTQPLNAISPIDQKFFELIIPIATFLTGTLSGIMLAGGDKDAQKMALQAATRPTTVSPAPTTPSTPSFSGVTTPAFVASAPAPSPFAPAVTTGFGGKPAPLQPPQPEI